ncbi:MAG: oxidoreductase [Alphaproteobacteria bacterium]|nr:oxidoreductase [Alphaproteobacteria bacterium]|tara:strand:+ start:3013 stop:4002 length:990 start_codon:yes stop_codon:yes gene_type:complete
MLNTAIIGLGRWGQRLVDSVQDLGRPKGDFIHFTRAVTRTPAKAADFAERHGMPIDSDYDSALSDPEIAAIALATPHTQHADQIEQAAAAGKHVFVEKPFTLTAENARQAVAACERAGVVLALGHNRRFFPSMIALKQMIGEGELGQILHLEGQFSSSYGLELTPQIWRAEGSESPAGGMTSLGIHCIDAFIHLNGPISRVQAYSLKQVLKVESNDTTAMLLRFSNGATGLLGTLTATARLFRLQIYGTKGWVRIDEDGSMTYCAVDGQPEARTFEKSDTCRAELEAFARAVSGTEPYLLPTDQAIHGIAVLEAIVASASNDGAAVDLD